MTQKPTKETALAPVQSRENVTRVVLVETPGTASRTVLRIVLIILLVLGFLWVLSRITGIILLLVLSIFFAYLVSPLVEFLRRPRTIGNRTVAIPKTVAIILSYLVILAAIVFVILVILPSLSNQFPEFANQAKEYWKSLGDKTQQIIEYSKSRRIPARGRRSPRSSEG